MADTLTPAQRSERMRRIRGRNTRPEHEVRRLLHRLGYRYRLHRHDLPGKPDIVFGKRKKVIFVNGCFWHRHADPSCHLARLPKSRLNFWLPKLTANAARDEKHQEALRKLGWDVLVVWECQIKNNEQLENIVTRFLEGALSHEGY
jgi:DNA mismatch endonuclease, patch repair protein